MCSVEDGGGALNHILKCVGEECDDFNLIDGDGCSRNCQRESGWLCVGMSNFSDILDESPWFGRRRLLEDQNQFGGYDGPAVVDGSRCQLLNLSLLQSPQECMETAEKLEFSATSVIEEDTGLHPAGK